MPRYSINAFTGPNVRVTIVSALACLLLFVAVALASGGGGIAAEAADAVILADDPTVASALLQEGIDVAVILNALRATFPSAPPEATTLPGERGT
jgi:hypothetical protein